MGPREAAMGINYCWGVRHEGDNQALEIDWSSLVSRHLPFPVDGLVFDERLTGRVV